MQHSTRPPTKAEQDRLDAIHAMPCIACEIEAEFARQRGETPLSQPLPTEAHHLTDRGYRIHSGGHMATLPLDGWHHRGELLYPHSQREMKQLYGPSLALHKREFKALYGSERELLSVVNAKLESEHASLSAA